MFQRRIQQMKLRIDELLYRWKSESSIRVHGAHMAPIQVCRLEERILMSATPVAAVAAEAASLNELTDAPTDDTAEPNAAATEDSTQETADRTLDNWSAMSTTQTREIVLVDTGAADYQQLVDDIINNADESRGFELFLFDSNRDGIEQITELLSNYRDLDAMHIVSHGTDGRVKLGNTWLSTNNFQAHGGRIAAWGQSLSTDADLLFYGCDLASNDDGRELLRSIGAVCDCDVAASDDLTGHASLGGDWDLEYATGVIDTSVAFGIDVQETWAGLFAVETLRDEFNSVSYSNNNGGVAWANDWQEIGESNGVSAGNVQVSSALGEQGLRIWQDGKGAMREADLSAATSATLSFDYARFGLDDPGDYVVIEVSANGGGSWFELDRFQGPANDGALQSASYDISGYIANNTQIRFVSSGMNATESLFVDNVQIEYDDTVAPGGVDTALNLWLRADADVTLAAGSKVTQWDNQVSTSPLTDVSASGSNRPALNVSALNFNPVISFDGSDDNLRDSSVLGSDLFASNAGSTFTVARVNSSGVILQWEENTNNRVNLEQALGAPRFDFGDDVPPDRLDGSPPGAGYHILNVEAAPGGPEPNLQIFVDGRLDVQGGASSANPLNNAVTGQFVLGEWAGGGVNADMDLGEVIIFGSDLTGAEQAQVDSYLAVKYGITLDQTAATNYVDSQGNVIWNATTNSTWNNDIAGIGRDLTSTLDQSQSRSISNDAIVTMSAASDQHNREFLIWGNDDGALTETATGNPVGVTQRLERIWRVDEAGDVGTTTITFDVSSLTITGTTAANLKLIVDTDTDFSTDVTLVGASGFAGGIVTFSGVNLADAQYFALGTDAATGSPVGPVGDTNAAADSVPENAGVGAAVGITALAADPDGVDAVTYTLDNDAGGLFDIDLNSGVVTVAAALDYESATSHDIIVRATSTDTSSNTQLFTINVINVNDPQHMLWMLDEFEHIHGGHYPGMITGKPVGMGGSLGRTEATGYGVIYCLREALAEKGIDATDTTASVQGFGNVAQYAIELYHQLGGKTVCVSSWDQGDQTTYAFYRESGVDLDELRGITNRFGGIDKAKAKDKGYNVLPGDAWLDREVDILIPSALENQITGENVSRISDRVKVIAEGANGPTTPEADAVLEKNGVFVIPDFLANAGGVTCSYFEQVQCNMNYFWSREEVLKKLDQKMTAAYHSISELAAKQKIFMRDAAYVVAINRVAAACRDRGWV